MNLWWVTLSVVDLNVVTIKWAGPKAEPFQVRQATEVNFVGASEASGGPCGGLLRTCGGSKSSN